MTRNSPILLAVALLLSLLASPRPAAAAEPRVVEITAKRF